MAQIDPNPRSGRKLGKGLNSLLQNPVRIATPGLAPVQPIGSLSPLSESAVRTPPPIELETGLRTIPISNIIPNKNQPRKSFEPGSLERLAQSIRSAGVMQPVLLRKNVGGKHELVAGERRWRAAQLAGLSAVPAIITDITDEESAEWALIENLQRDDLGAMEKAWALRSLTEKFGLTHTQIADKVGLDRSSVTNIIRLTELEQEIVALLEQRRLTLGHGKALLAVPGGPARIEFARRAAEEEWSVRRLERESTKAVTSPTAVGGSTPAATSLSGAPHTALERDAGIRDLEEQLTKFLGTKVELAVVKGGEKGRIVVSFFGLDHFDSLMAKIGFQAR